jgi:PAS domain S-box-containing protein
MNDESKTRVQLVEELAELRRKVAELEAVEADQESEQRYQDLLGASPDPVVVYDVEDRVTYVNEAFVHTYGWSREELLGRRTDFFVPPEEVERTREVIARGFRGETVLFETKRLKNDGGLLDIQLTGAVLRDRDGNISESIVVHRDITAQKQAEEALRASEERFRDIAQSMADWIWEVDENGVYTFCSERVEEILGYSPDEILGQTPFDLMPPDEVERVGEEFSEIARNRAPIKDLENWNLNRNGKPVCLLTNGMPVFDDQGNFLGYRGVDKDITELKLAEEQLRASEEKHRLLAENIQEVIWSLDLATFRLTYISPSVVKKSGYTVQELLDLPLEKRMSPESYQTVVKVFQEEMALEATGRADPDRSRTLELIEYTKDGQTVWVESTMSFLRDQEGQAIGIVGVSRDITERRRAEAALKESEEKYSTLVENATDGVVIIQDEKYKYANPAWIDITGYTFEEFAKMSIGVIVLPEYRDLVREKHRARAMREDGQSAYEVKIQCKDGEIRDVESCGMGIQYEGRPASMAVLRDITERKRAEEALRESEEKYRTTLRSTPDTVAISRVEDGRFLELNDGFTRMFGYSREEAIGKTVKELGLYFVPEDRERLIEVLTTKEEVNEFEFKYRRKDGTSFEGMQSARPFRYGDEDCLISVVKDISLLKKAEKALKESEKMYRNLFENVYDVYYRLDQEGTILLISPSAERIFGYTPDEVVGKDIKQYCVNPKEGEKFLAQLTKAGNVENFETQLRRKDNTVIWVSTNAKLLWDEGGNVSGVEGITRDVTEHKQAENEKLQGEKLQAAIETAGAACHELNQPLQTILGLTELALQDLPIDDPQRSVFETILSQAEKMGEVTGRLNRLTHYRTKPYLDKRRILDIKKSS